MRPPDDKSLVRAHEIFRASLPRVDLLLGSEGNAFATAGPLEDEILAITAVHPLREEALRTLLEKADAPWQLVERLLATGSLRRVEYDGRHFFVRTPDGLEDA